MENTNKISFKYFDQSLVQRVIDFTELTADKKTKEATKAFSEEIKGIYNKKDNELKQHIKEQLPVLKQAGVVDSGGMGLNLIAQVVSSMNYERKNDRNVFTLFISL